MQAKSPLAAEFDDLAAEIADQAATNRFMDRYLNDSCGGEPMAPPDFVDANTLTKDVNDIDGRDIGAANADDKVGPDIEASDANRLSVHRATSGELVFGQGSASNNANATVLRDSQGRLENVRSDLGEGTTFDVTYSGLDSLRQKQSVQ